MRIRLLIAVVVTTACFFKPAEAGIVFYFDRTSFQAASDTLATESLDILTSTGGSSTVQPTGVTIIGNGPGGFSVDTSSTFSSEGTGSLRTSSVIDGDTIAFDFATPIRGFGIDFLDSSPDFDFDLSAGGASQNYFSNRSHTTTTNGPLFLGVRDTMGSFSQVVISSNTSPLTVNFDFIQFQSVPEPTSALFLCGSGVLACLRRRRR